MLNFYRVSRVLDPPIQSSEPCILISHSSCVQYLIELVPLSGFAQQF